ncbi:MAG: UvrD-helicase domain-containing protein [Paludibacteraceae bacterium]|nr:UvrD-helicase domain-containing protein [Paludibacteraceae bacterium]
MDRLDSPTLKIYKASAGSGKTYRLVVEYVKLLIEDPEAYANILAVTFTNKATSEMKSRILSELYGIANGLQDSDSYLHSIQKELSQGEKKWSYDEIRRKAKAALVSILHNYSRFRIETIDSFFQSILKNLAKELGLGAYMNIELDSNAPLKEAVNELFDKVKEDPDLMQWISDYIHDKIEGNASWKVSDELMNFGKNIFREEFKKMEHEIDIETRESGSINLLKEKGALDKYQKDLKKKRDEILKTLIQKAQRFRDLSNKHNLSTEDFSYKDKGVVSFFNKIIDSKIFPEEMGKRSSECLENAEKWVAKSHPRYAEIIDLAERELIPILEETEKYREEHLSDFNSINLIIKDINKLGLLHDLATIISKNNSKNNQFMLADTPSLLNEMIGENDAPFIYEKVGAYINHIMIDEFQDTSLTQWKNFKPLLEEGLSQNALSLIVGDPKQAIYRWRNSDWRTISNIDKEITNVPVGIFPMETNWRSKKNIIRFNNQFFKTALEIISKEMEGKNENMQIAYADVCQKSSEEVDEGWVHVEFLDKGDHNMLERLREQIENLQDHGISADKITILLRKNKNIPIIAQYLSDYKNREPELASRYVYDVISDEAYELSSSLALQILIQALQFISEPENGIYKAQLVFSYLTEILGKEANDTARSYLYDKENPIIQELEEKLKKASLLPLYEMVETVYEILELHKIKNQESYMQSFLDGLNDFLVNKSSDLNQFLLHWEEKLKSTTIPFSSEINGIKLMSIHKSKGLEFHTVILPFCDWALTTERGLTPLLWCKAKEEPYSELPLIPISYGKEMINSIFSDQYYEETEQLYVDNLNILYVALTRAQKNLIILCTDQEKIEPTKSISHLLKATLMTDSEHWNEEENSFSIGELYDKTIGKEEKESSNILKKKPRTTSSDYQSYKQKASFRQSNQSRDFINDEEPQRNQYIDKGKVLHALFSLIKTKNDIGKAIDSLLFEGVISEEEKEGLREFVEKAINQEEAKEWFADGLELFNECEIVYKENGVAQNCRPDRVIKKGNEMTIIDYKFGKKETKYIKQVRQYIDLIQQMGYTANGYVWYVENGEIVEA